MQVKSSAACLPSVAILLASPSVAADTPTTIIPTDGMTITSSVTLKPGVYALPKGITIAADGVTIDAKGVTLMGAGTDQAVFAKGVKDFAIRGLEAQRYKWGVNVHGGSNISVERCRIRDTAEEPPDDVWLDIWKGPEDPYGAAIILEDVVGGHVADNDLQHQQNGISLYNCSGLTLERNNASFESGWGIHLYKSSGNTIQDNLADWCNRIHKRGVREYYPGADASGMVMVWSSSKNTVRRNFFRGGGDGVFIAGYHAPDNKVPCNDNVFEDNDCSYSPNNAFESTFCKGNVFRNNRAGQSNYGFWLGYSTDNVVENNDIRRNRIAGIAIEHGIHNTFTGNRLGANSRGIALWSKSAAGFLDDFPDQRASAHNVIKDNTFTANGIGFFSKRDGDDPRADPNGDAFSGNLFYGNGTGALLLNSDKATFHDNRFEANTSTGLRVEGGEGTTATGNFFVGQPIHAWANKAVKWTDRTGNYWSGAKGASYKPAGPARTADTAPLKTVPPLPAGRLTTEDQALRSTPG